MAQATTATLTQALLDVYSKDLLHSALPTMRWMDFVVMREDLMQADGGTVVFTKYDDVTGDAELTEGTPLTADAMTASTISISVTEYGKALSMTEKLLELSWDDLLAEAALLLGRHYAQWGPDYLMRTVAATSSSNTVYGGGKTARTGLAATDYLDTDVIRESVEILQVNNAPKFRVGGDEFYVSIIHPHQARYLKQDPDWVSAHNMHSDGMVFSGVLGRFEDVLFVESTNNFNGTAAVTSPAFLDVGANGNNDLVAGEAGNAIDIYMGHIFGDMFLAFASALPVELRSDGITDFSRSHALAWYSLYGGGTIHPEYGVVIETA